MNKKSIFAACMVAILSTAGAVAQNRTLPVLSVSNEAGSASIGAITVTGSGGIHIYTNPAFFVLGDNKGAVDVSAAMFSKQEGDVGQFGVYSAGAAYRVAGRHAILAGFRYAGGLKIAGFDALGNPTKDYKPYDWTADIAYTYRFSTRFAAFIAGSAVYSHLAKNARGGSVSFGAVYNSENIKLGSVPARYSISTRVSDLGPKLDYGSTEVNLPASAAIGGRLEMDLAPEHMLTAAVASRYYFMPSHDKLLTAGIGAEYMYNRTVAVRAGYELSQHNLSHITLGAGLCYKGLRLNAGYLLKTNNQGSNNFIVGLGFDF